MDLSQGEHRLVADVGLRRRGCVITAMLVRLGSDVCGHSIPHYLIISVHINCKLTLTLTSCAAVSPAPPLRCKMSSGDDDHDYGKVFVMNSLEEVTSELGGSDKVGVFKVDGGSGNNNAGWAGNNVHEYGGSRNVLGMTICIPAPAVHRDVLLRVQ